MSRPSVTPTDHERPFGADELFFSTTDRRGVILTGNDVFVRVSGYALDELVGKPHNIIRHPDMPRAVFRLLWDYLDRNATFAGYVKNMAADGGYYWVLALVVPVKEGYLSIRFKPSSPFFAAAQQLYPQLLAAERAAGTDPDGRRRGMDEAGRQLVAALSTLGFPSYDHFMQAALAAELAARASRHGGAGPSAGEREPGADAWLDDLLDASQDVEAHLRAIFVHVEDFLRNVGTLEGKAAFLLDLSLNVHFVALNALIASYRLGAGSEGLAAVAQNLASQSHDSMDTIDGMTRQLVSLTSALRDIALSLSAATLQVEATAFFLQELIGAAHAGRRDTDLRRIGTLAESIADSARLLSNALPRASDAVPLLAQLQDRLTADLHRLACLHMLGKVQASSVESGGAFLELLERISSQLTAATGHRRELREGIAAIKAQLPPFATAVRGAQAPIDGFCRLASERR